MSPTLGSSRMAAGVELVWGSPTEGDLREESLLRSACHRPGSAAYLLCDKSLPLKSLSFPI